MTQPVIRILGVAPYEGMKTTLQRVAEEYPDVHLDVYTGDMQAGVEIVKEHQEEAYDVILSRGGTAELIRTVTDTPVVSVQLSVYDILRAIKMAENYSNLYAIVGFPSITEPAHILCDLLQMEVDIITIHNADEVDNTLDRLKDGDYKMVVGDMITHTVARKKGFDAFLITSGLESFHDALNQAISTSNQFRRLRRENYFLKQFAKEKNGNAIILDEHGELQYYTQEQPTSHQLEILRAHISQIPITNSLIFHQNDHGQLYKITARILRHDHTRYYGFVYQTSQISLRTGKSGIHAFSEAEATHLFMSSFYSISGAMGGLDRVLTSVAATRQPVMILGESGTGKEQIARALYLRSPRVNRSFIVVDCKAMTDKSWDYLFSHYSSPLNEEDGTIYFQNLDAFPENYWQEMLSAMTETDIIKRLRLIFSCTIGEGQPPTEITKTLSARLGCYTLQLPTLRSRADELPSLASLYLSNLNMELGKQIIGFDPHAAELLFHYEWPNNYTQFKQVLQELATVTDSAYIRRSTVLDCLTKQRTLYRSASSHPTDTAFVPRTLEEITRQAVQQTLDSVNGNHTAAARLLGISRTTLWRHLSDE